MDKKLTDTEEHGLTKTQRRVWRKEMKRRAKEVEKIIRELNEAKRVTADTMWLEFTI